MQISWVVLIFRINFFNKVNVETVKNFKPLISRWILIIGKQLNIILKEETLQILR